MHVYLITHAIVGLLRADSMVGLTDFIQQFFVSVQHYDCVRGEKYWRKQGLYSL